MKTEKNRNLLKAGTFSVLTSLIMLAILIFVNLTFLKLPSEWTEVDISSAGLYELSDQTTQIVSGVTKETDIFWIVQSGNENSELEVLLNRYADLNSCIKVTRIDPIVNPNFTDQYTSEVILENSLIVASGERSRYVAYDDIFTTSGGYYDQSSTTTYFNGEEKLTSAIDYVNDGYTPKIYRVMGHGEATLSNAFEEALDRENYQLEKLNTLSLSDIPEDADCLLIVGPTADITETESDVMNAYLDRGGRILAFTDCEHTDLPNLMKLLLRYSIEVVDGLVLEGDQNMCYGNYPMQLLPGIVSHDITAPITRSGYMVLVPMAHGLKVPETAPSGCTITSLLKTSASAYAKTGRITSLSRASEDESGPFTVGAAVEEKTGSGGKARLVWYTSSQIIKSEYDEIVNGINTDLILNSLGWLTENQKSITIHSKQISGSKLAVPAGVVNKIAVVLIGIIPLIYLMTGIIITVRRRRK